MHDFFTDHPSWLAQIKAAGNTPEDWLQYTNYVRDHVQFSDDMSRKEYLTNVYYKALKVSSELVLVLLCKLVKICGLTSMMPAQQHWLRCLALVNIAFSLKSTGDFS